MIRFGTVVALLALGASTAFAQGGLSAGHLGASFGVSFPTGALSGTHATGFNMSGLAEYQAPGQAMGIRGELFYERFGAKTGTTNVHAVQTFAGIVNAVYHFEGSTFHPYLIGGMGLYAVSDNRSSPGFNFGAGIEIPLSGMTAHFEARLHKVLTNRTSYLTLPISFGLSF